MLFSLRRKENEKSSTTLVGEWSSVSPYRMVDDSIDVDKLLIRTWHTLPADLGRGQGSHKGRHITWAGGLTCLDVGLGLRRMRHTSRMDHGLKYVILGVKCSDTWVTRVDGQNSLDNSRVLVFFIEEG